MIRCRILALDNVADFGYGLQLLYINVFDTARYPGKSWEQIDYSDDRNHGQIMHKHTHPRMVSKEAKAGNNDWQSPQIVTYAKAEKAACILEFGPKARC
jgi:hypothetical protein